MCTRILFHTVKNGKRSKKAEIVPKYGQERGGERERKRESHREITRSHLLDYIRCVSISQKLCSSLFVWTLHWAPDKCNATTEGEWGTVITICNWIFIWLHTHTQTEWGRWNIEIFTFSFFFEHAPRCIRNHFSKDEHSHINCALIFRTKNIDRYAVANDDFEIESNTFSLRMRKRRSTWTNP